jgi:hypothetical protein
MQRLIGRAGLLGLAVLLTACPYEAPFEPQGQVLRPEGALVGSWVCRSPDDEATFSLLLGRADSRTYSLLFRPGPGAKDLTDDDRKPLAVDARPMRVAGRLVWALRLPDDPDTPGVYLAPVVSARRDSLRLRIVESERLPEEPASPRALTAALTEAWTRPGFASELIRCRRP